MTRCQVCVCVPSSSQGNLLWAASIDNSSLARPAFNAGHWHLRRRKVLQLQRAKTTRLPSGIPNAWLLQWTDCSRWRLVKAGDARHTHQTLYPASRYCCRDRLMPAAQGQPWLFPPFGSPQAADCRPIRGLKDGLGLEESRLANVHMSSAASFNGLYNTVVAHAARP